MKVSAENSNNSHEVLKYVSMFCAVMSALFVVSLLLLVAGAVVAKITGGSGVNNGSNELTQFSWATIASQPEILLFYVWVGTVFLGGWIIFVTGIITSSIYLKKMRQLRLPLRLAMIMRAINIAGLVAVPASFVVFLITYAFTCSGSC